MSVLFFCALIILGSYFIWEGAPFFLSVMGQENRVAVPAILIDFAIESVPNVKGGTRQRIKRCEYRYQFEGKTYMGHRFSLFDSHRYSWDLPSHHRRIVGNPVAYIDPQSPMDAVLLLSPPLSALLAILVGLLFLHLGLVFFLRWLLRKQDQKRSRSLWQKERRLPPERSPLITPLLLIPGLVLVLLLLCSFALVPRTISSQIGAAVALATFLIALAAYTSWYILRLRRHLRMCIGASWTPRNGLQIDTLSARGITQATLWIRQLRQSRFSWKYLPMGQGDFDMGEPILSLAPYSFKASSPWLCPLCVISSAQRAQRDKMKAESESLCQILAGQNNRHKGPSPLMGLIRKRPDHLLQISLRHARGKVFYLLPVSFWTSEISR